MSRTKIATSQVQVLTGTYLGHVVSTQGVSPDTEKMSKIKSWPVPQSAQEVQQFLGLANYYRWFIKDFANMAKPLHWLTKRGITFTWTPECENVFNFLKTWLTPAPPWHSLICHSHLYWTPMPVTLVSAPCSSNCKRMGMSVW